LLLKLPQRGNGPQRREEFWALRDVNLDVAPGEAVGLIGANGAGKSTALKLISRIIVPTSGRILVGGRIGALLELGAGFHPDLTGRENIYLNGSILGLDRAQIRSKLDEIVRFAELERFVDVPVKHYSSGMYVRLGFSVAIHTDPDILLIDEVLAVGDQNFQHKCIERIMDMQRQGVTICFVSHSLDAVRRVCSQAVWLEAGMVKAAGDVEDTITAYLRHSAAEEEARIHAGSALGSPISGSSAGCEPIPADGEVTGSQKRWGTGEVEIVAVTFHDGTGAERHVFPVGDPWIARVHYRACRSVDVPVFGLAVNRDDGVHISGPNTHFAGLDIPRIEGEGYVSYRVEALPLMEGTYWVSASVHNRADTVMYDYRDRMYVFRVRRTAHGERYGVMSLGGEWTWDEQAH
jgi:lipopolysaccharide transport system ATP-binding protein